MLSLLVVIGLLAPAAAMAIDPTGSFSHRVPRSGSSTDNAEFITSGSFNDINLRFTTIPYDTDVKPVRCDNLADIAGYERYGANDTSWDEIAFDQPAGVCYRLNMAAPTVNFFDVVGDVAD